MPDARYRWIIVLAGGVLGCVAFGAMFSLPVVLQPLARSTGWSVTGVSAAMTIAFLTMAAGSIFWGSLSDRIGARPVALLGTLLLGASLFLASRAPSLPVFQWVFGIGVGGAAAAIFAPMMACVTAWFDTRRSLAVSLVSAGMGMAPMTLSPLAAWLVTHHDWRRTLATLALIAVAVMLPVAACVRRAPARALADPPAPRAPGGAPMSVAQALKSAPFLVLLLTNFFCCATHSGPIIHTVSYAVTCGIPTIAAVSIYSLEGFAGLFGRLAFGVLGDRFGAWRVLAAGLLAQALGTLGYVLAGGLAGFYAAAALFGFIYAGVMPLYAVIAREHFPVRMMGTIIGGLAMAGSLGMATGPVAGGLIYDTIGNYRWLYLTSFALGLASFGMALLFRPVSRRRALAFG